MYKCETAAECQFTKLKYKHLIHTICTFSPHVQIYMRIDIILRKNIWIYVVEMLAQGWGHSISPGWGLSLPGVSSPWIWSFLGRQEPGMGGWNKCWTLSSFPPWPSSYSLYLSPGYLIHAHNLYHGIEADDSQIRISASTSSPSCNPSICLPACHFPLNVSKASQNMHISQTNSWSFPSKPFLLGFCLGERHCLYLAARCRIAGVALGKILSLTTLIIYSFPSPVDSSF